MLLNQTTLASLHNFLASWSGSRRYTTKQTQHKQLPILPPWRSCRCVSSVMRNFRILIRWWVYVCNILTGMIQFSQTQTCHPMTNQWAWGIFQCDFRRSKYKMFHLSLTCHIHIFSAPLMRLVSIKLISTRSLPQKNFRKRNNCWI